MNKLVLSWVQWQFIQVQLSLCKKVYRFTIYYLDHVFMLYLNSSNDYYIHFPITMCYICESSWIINNNNFHCEISFNCLNLCVTKRILSYMYIVRMKNMKENILNNNLCFKAVLVYLYIKLCTYSENISSAMLLIKLSEFLVYRDLNTTLIIQFKKKKLKSTSMTISKRVSTYLGHHLSRPVILICNINFKP